MWTHHEVLLVGGEVCRFPNLHSCKTPPFGKQHPWAINYKSEHVSSETEYQTQVGILLWQ